MKLKEYFDTEGVNPAEFAFRLKISIASIYRYMNHGVSPSRTRAKNIEVATKGKVTVLDLRGDND